MNSRLISIIRKEFIQITRDPRTLVLIVVMPIMQLFLLGYAATTDIKNISLAVWDQSQSAPSRALLDAFRAANYFSIDYPVGSEQEYKDLIEQGKIRVFIDRSYPLSEAKEALIYLHKGRARGKVVLLNS